MSGYVYSRVTSLRMPEERLLVPRDGLFDTMKVTTCMPSCTILRKANLPQCFHLKIRSRGTILAHGKVKGRHELYDAFQGGSKDSK